MELFSSLQNAVLPFKKIIRKQNNNQHRNKEKKNLYKYHIYNLAKPNSSRKDLPSRLGVTAEDKALHSVWEHNV